MKNVTRHSRGFTLIELMITLTLLAIMLGLAVPSFMSFFDKKRLISTAEQVYGHLSQARMEAISRSTVVRANFSANGGTGWQYGFSVNNLCDVTQTAPTGANACVLVVDDGDGLIDPGNGLVDAADLVLNRHAGDNDVGMSITNFSSGSTQISFDPVRGTSDSGEILLQSAAGKQLKVKVSLIGQIRICSPDNSVMEYENTGC